METTAEQIKKLEQELAALKEKERKEKEEAQKKAEAERDADLLAIMDSIKAFNKKHGESYSLVKSIKIKADDFPYRKHLPSDFTVEFTGEPINKTFLEHLESYWGD